MAEIRVPTLGESVTEATIGKWFKKPGEAVAVDEPLVELETDKVTDRGAGARRRRAGRTSPSRTARPSRSARCSARSRRAPARRRLPSLPRRSCRQKAAPTPPKPAAGAPPKAAPSGDKPIAPSVRTQSRPRPASIRRASPAPARTAASPRATCWPRSSAPPSRPTPVAQPAAAIQVRAPSPPMTPAREERVKMTRLRQTIARRLKDAQNTAAMLTTFNEVDMSAVMHMRTQYKDPVREAPRREARLHGLLREGLRAGAEGHSVPSTPRSTAPT